MPRKDAPSGPISAQAQQDLVSDGIENFELPRSLVTKIAKSALPDNAKLQKETVLSLVKGSTVFINYLAATAHDVAISKQHKSISASDVLKALETIEFGDLVETLQNELLIYRANSKTDRKKPPSTAAAAPAPAAAAASAPPRPAPKPKPKDLGAPFTSAPLVHHALPAHAHEGAIQVDWEAPAPPSVSVSTAGAGYADADREAEDEGDDDVDDRDSDGVDDDEDEADENDIAPEAADNELMKADEQWGVGADRV